VQNHSSPRESPTTDGLRCAGARHRLYDSNRQLSAHAARGGAIGDRQPCGPRLIVSKGLCWRRSHWPCLQRWRTCSLRQTACSSDRQLAKQGERRHHRYRKERGEQVAGGLKPPRRDIRLRIRFTGS
jgi:hypothetical protein